MKESSNNIKRSYNFYFLINMLPNKTYFLGINLNARDINDILV